jgi:hypothetical protein
MSDLHNSPDAEILAAWEARQKSLAIIESRGTYFDSESHSPEEHAALEEAECLISQSTPATLEGTRVKLWLALSVIGESITQADAMQHDIIRRAVIADVEAIAGEFDHEQALVFGAIKSLTAQIEGFWNFQDGGDDADMITALKEHRRLNVEYYRYDEATPPKGWNGDAIHKAAEAALCKVEGATATTLHGVCARLEALIPSLDQERWVDAELARDGFETIYRQRANLNGNAEQLVQAIYELRLIVSRTATARAQWDAQWNRYQAAEEAFQVFDCEVYKPLEAQFEALLAENGYVRGKPGFEEGRAKFLPLHGVTSEISDLQDELSERAADEQTALLNTPAPDLAALRWKLDHLFWLEPDEPDASTSSWRRKYIAQTVADYRRLLSDGVAGAIATAEPVSPEIAAAFEKWKLSELAAHYAAPCPDEVMNCLAAWTGETFEALSALEPQSADDMLLKLFPVLLREFEPKVGEPMLKLSQSNSYVYHDVFITRVNQDLARLSPTLAKAMAEPDPYAERED